MGEPAVPNIGPVVFDSTQASTGGGAGQYSFVEPDSTHLADGWQNQEIPSAGNFNWLVNMVTAWVTWLYQFVLLFPGAQAPTALTITSNEIVPTMGSHSLAASGTINSISGANLNPGRLLRLHGSTGQSVVLANNTGGGGGYLPITTADGNSITLNTEQDIVELRLNAGGTFWRETFRSASLVGAGPPVFEARLTLASGVPITTTDQTGATTIYLTPFKGGQVSLWDGVKWVASLLAEISIAVPATTSQMYDLFLYLSGGVLTLEAVAWTNDTTRATTLTLQNGIYCKTGTLTHRYVGSFRTTTSSGQTEDSLAKRYLWNYYNRAQRPMLYSGLSGNYNYSTNTWRQANANTSAQLDFVVGVSEDSVYGDVSSWGFSNSGSTAGAIAIGLNSTTSPTGSIGYANGLLTSNVLPLNAEIKAIPSIGRNVLVWLECGNGNLGFVVSTSLGANTLTAAISGMVRG